MFTFFCDASTKTNIFLKASPSLVDAASGTLRLVDSLLKATNVTVPLVLEVKINYSSSGLFWLNIKGVQEFVDTLPLVLGFASAYAEVQKEKNHEVGSQRCSL